MSKPLGPDDVTSIVIETGSSATRVGFSGDYSPKYVIPTVYGKIAGEHSPSGKDQYSFGNVDINVPESHKEIYCPLSDGLIQDWPGVSRLWTYIYEHELGMDPREQPLVIPEPTWNPVENKQRALEVALEEFQVPVFSLLKAPLCATYESTKPTALVIDVGAAVASVTPVVDGNVLTRASFHSRFAGDFVNAHIASHLQTQRNLSVTPHYQVASKSVSDPGQPANPSLKTFEDGFISDSYHAYQVQRVLAEFKESTSQVSEVPFNPASLPFARVGSRPFEFPTGFNMSFGPERFTTTEPLFKPSQFPLPNMPPLENAHGLGDMIYGAVTRAIDSSASQSATGLADSYLKNLLSNIIITGGTTLLQGFTSRIEYELGQYFPSHQPRYTIAPTAADRKATTWTGASIVASLGSFDSNVWVTKQDYEEIGALGLAEKRFR
uniref:ARAD1C18436p n=1 Tax=Blastobotrys adeninivorans TaxID=409370 RepID=A0A060T6C5_BLAAD